MAIRLNMGCGAQVINRPGWLNLDLGNPRTDVTVVPIDIRGPLPWADDEVDLIVSSHSLEHLEEPAAALREWHRVLRRGGKLVIAVPDARHKDVWIGIHERTLAARGNSELEDHHVDFDRAGLEAALRDAGAWASILGINPASRWELPGKAWWQLCVEATK